MRQETIRIGIDLGTTNSSVACVHQNEVQILKNSLGEEGTPSVLLADRNGNILVGSKAKRVLNNSKTNIQNCKSEIKRLMGSPETVFFPNLNKAMLPEEVSAEILKALLGDVQRKYPEIPIESAVITVPAYFSTIQSEATKRAGILAGLRHVLLLQEPIAAAIAYGFLNQKDENWLVYDLGGGTFDVALIALRDGALTVLAHRGDNFLGGKDFDAAIIYDHIMPSLAATGISVDLSTHPELFRHLKDLAEIAKIELTSSEKTTIDIDFQTDDGEIQHSVELSRGDLLACCRHLLNKTAGICRRTISDAQVNPATIKKIVLVGGPTQMPVLRSYLRDELGITVDGSLDPLTVVARGAAMFGNQTIVSLPKDVTEDSDPNIFCQLEVNYSPVTSDDEQTITGKIVQFTGDSIPYSVLFASAEDTFTSENILIKDGKFILTLPTGEKGTEYWVYVQDSQNQLIPSSPEKIRVSRGVSIIGAPLPYSIGVSVISISSQKRYSDATERMEFFFKRNSILPLKQTKRFHTFTDIKAGCPDNALPICLYEGESLITNRNTLICHLSVTGKALARDLKQGSPVDITVEINESRELSVMAFLPEADITLNARETLYFDATLMDEVEQDFSEQVARSKALPDSAELATEAAAIRSMIQDVQATIERSGSDSDQQRKAEKQVKDLMIALDYLEAKTKHQVNVGVFWQTSQDLSDYLEDCWPQEKQSDYEAIFHTLKNEGLSAIAKQDPVWIEHVVEKLRQLHLKCQYGDFRILASWIRGLLRDVQARDHGHATLANLVSRAQAALGNPDVREMQEIVHALLPFTREEDNPEVKLVKSGITL